MKIRLCVAALVFWVFVPLSPPTTKPPLLALFPSREEDCRPLARHHRPLAQCPHCVL